MSDTPPAPDSAPDSSVETGPVEAAPARPRRKLVGRILLGVLVVGLVVGGYEYIDYRNNGQYFQTTEDAYVRADGVAISSKLAGYIRTVNVAENQAVAAGTLLAEVDPTDYRTRLAQAEAQVNVARATENSTRAGIGEAEAGVREAEAALAASSRDLAYLNGEVARYRPLVATGAEPKQMLAQLASNRDKAAADVKARQAAVAAARSRVASVRAQVGQSAAQIEAARTQQEAARNDLRTTTLVAPTAGRVASSTVRVGQFVQPGQRLMTIVPVDAIYVEANFKETQIGLMRPGQPVTMNVDALPGVDFHGTVESITPGTGASFSLVPPQNATGNFTKIVQRVPVRIRINAGPESRRVLVPGLSIHVRVDTRTSAEAIERIRREQEAKAPR